MSTTANRFGRRTLLPLPLMLLSAGCGGCEPEITAVPSPDGRRVVTVETLDLCGGATTGYVTDVFLGPRRPGWFDRKVNIFSSTGLPRVEVNWATDSRVVIRYRPDMGNRVLARKVRMEGVAIEYEVLD